MNQIASGDIKCGMRFSAPVFFDDGKNMFLAEGKSAKGYHIAALKRWTIPFVLTAGHEMKGEELERYLARAKKKAEQAAASVAKPASRKSGVKVNMEDTADVTDLFADDVEEAKKDRTGEDENNAGAIKVLKVEPEIEAEDVTSMFM